MPPIMKLLALHFVDSGYGAASHTFLNRENQRITWITWWETEDWYQGSIFWISSLFWSFSWMQTRYKINRIPTIPFLCENEYASCKSQLQPKFSYELRVPRVLLTNSGAPSLLRAQFRFRFPEKSVNVTRLSVTHARIIHLRLRFYRWVLSFWWTYPSRGRSRLGKLLATWCNIPAPSWLSQFHQPGNCRWTWQNYSKRFWRIKDRFELPKTSG